MKNSEELVTVTEQMKISTEEFQTIERILGREPNSLEQEVLSVMWSEHASYKSSRNLLELLPTKGEKVVVKAFEESAGAVDLGDGMACVLKIESYNHPCAIQPQLGASTGMRVVSRDILSMGARPIAFLNSLRFGNQDRNTAKWLFSEVVNGMQEFERQTNVPIVGGETFFTSGFVVSPVVNNMVVGVTPKNKLIRGVAHGIGNLIAVIGAKTDAEISSLELLEEEIAHAKVSYESLSNLDIENQLWEAVYLLNDRNLILGLQSVGGQGIVGAAIEMAQKGKSGIDIEFQKIPVYDNTLSMENRLLSQTWGRMLMCISPEHANEIAALLEPFGLNFTVIGKVSEGNSVKCWDKNELCATIPTEYVGMGSKSTIHHLTEKQDFEKLAVDVKIETIPEPDHYPSIVKKMMSMLNVAGKKWIIDRFNQAIQHEGGLQRLPSDASILEVASTGKSLAMTVDGNPNYMNGNPIIGAQIAVAEAARNIVCGGGKPLAITNCLNFGDPNDPHVYWQFANSIKGIKIVADRLNIPVVSGNVSFYNQFTDEGKVDAITPSPVIGMVGVVEEPLPHTTIAFKHKGDLIYLIGQSSNDINGSEYLIQMHKISNSVPPQFDLETEVKVQNAISELIEQCLIRSVHDVSNGGLYFTLLEMGLPLGYGFDITSDAEVRKDAFLFGESQSRVVVSVAVDKHELFLDEMMKKGVNFYNLGHVTKGEIRIDDESYGLIADAKSSFENYLKVWSE